ncbi:MAG: glycosyltransferase, partial [Patescibacteria group bacterium]|nr:glycosyltransferase [Patescibacteria group bacterium]
IESVLNQCYKDFELLIVDNASTDQTEAITNSYKDSRIKYIRNEKNIGMRRNWNKCIDLARGKYLMILGDDDILRTDFLEKSMEIHHSHHNLGFTFSHCNKVDEDGRFLMRWGYDFTPVGVLDSLDYLYYTLKYEACLTNSSTVLAQKQAYIDLNKFQKEFGSNTFDFNMWIKIASKYNVFFIDKVLCDYRIHSKQVSELHWRRQEKPTGKIGTYLELYKIIATLNRKDVSELVTRKFLQDKTITITKKLAKLISTLAPEF